MPSPIIGQCGSCGAPNVSLHFTQYAVLVDSGMTEPICSGCEERIITKRKAEILKDDSIPRAERNALVAGIRVKVTDVAPAAPAAVAIDAVPTEAAPSKKQ